MSEEKKYKLLIADDSLTILYYLEDLLKSAGYIVITAKNGLEAAEKVYAEKPDLIISDIEMPKMNGYQFCRLLKNEEFIRDIPVILLTSKTQASSKFWGLETGADMYITKDFEAEDLLSNIEILINTAVQSNLRHKLENVSEAAASDLLSKINMMLDKKLYETTIINKISEIGYSITDMKQTINYIFNLLNKIIDFQIGTIVLIEQQVVKVFLYVNRLSDVTFMQDYEYFILQRVTEIFDLNLEDMEIELEEFNAENESENKGHIFRERDAFLRTISVHNENIGIFSLINFYTKGFNQDNIDLLNKLKSHIDIIVDNARMYNKIKNLSIYDGLTNLFNRRYFMELLETEFIRSVRYGLQLSLMILDIDNFKQVNDTYGHLSGDIVLKNISKIMKNSVRSIDFVGRYGGEEFVVCFPETNKKMAINIAERIRTNIFEKEHKLDTGDSIKLTVSIGLASFEDGEFTNKKDFLKLSDERVYAAKRTGKNRVISENVEE